MLIPKTIICQIGSKNYAMERKSQSHPKASDISCFRIAESYGKLRPAAIKSYYKPVLNETGKL
jgi:hypothetical protein